MNVQGGLNWGVYHMNVAIFFFLKKKKTILSDITPIPSIIQGHLLLSNMVLVQYPVSLAMMMSKLVT
jgi:hypothetical protein